MELLGPRAAQRNQGVAGRARPEAGYHNGRAMRDIHHRLVHGFADLALHSLPLAPLPLHGAILDFRRSYCPPFFLYEGHTALSRPSPGALRSDETATPVEYSHRVVKGRVAKRCQAVNRDEAPCWALPRPIDPIAVYRQAMSDEGRPWVQSLSKGHVGAGWVGISPCRGTKTKKGCNVHNVHPVH